MAVLCNNKLLMLLANTLPSMPSCWSHFCVLLQTGQVQPSAALFCISLHHLLVHTCIRSRTSVCYFTKCMNTIKTNKTSVRASIVESQSNLHHTLIHALPVPRCPPNLRWLSAQCANSRAGLGMDQGQDGPCQGRSCSARPPTLSRSLINLVFIRNNTVLSENKMNHNLVSGHLQCLHKAEPSPGAPAALLLECSAV